MGGVYEGQNLSWRSLARRIKGEGVVPNVEQGLRWVERDLKSERRRSLGWGRSLRWVVLC